MHNDKFIQHVRVKGPSMPLFSKRDQAYNSVIELFQPFISFPPDLDSVPAAIRAKQKQFGREERENLVRVIRRQTSDLNIQIPEVESSIEALNDEKSFAFGHLPADQFAVRIDR